MLRLCPRTTPTQRRDGNTAPSREEENAVNTEIQVDRLVIQANRAKLADKYEKRLRRIARLAKRIRERPTMMGVDDIADVLQISELAEKKP